MLLYTTARICASCFLCSFYVACCLHPAKSMPGKFLKIFCFSCHKTALSNVYIYESISHRRQKEGTRYDTCLSCNRRRCAGAGPCRFFGRIHPPCLMFPPLFRYPAAGSLRPAAPLFLRKLSRPGVYQRKTVGHVLGFLSNIKKASESKFRSLF